MRVFKWIPVTLFGALLLSARTGFVLQPAAARQQPQKGQPLESQTEWPGYGGGPDGIRYSSLYTDRPLERQPTAGRMDL